MDKEKRYAAGIEILQKMISAEEFETISTMKDISPDFWDLIVGFGYGEIYGREGLELSKKSIVTISSLLTQGAFDQLEFHIRAALKIGLSKNEVIEIIIHCAAYAGFPKAVQAMTIAKKVFEE